MWATRAWWLLDAFGFEGDVSVLDGGLDAWTAAGGDVASGPAAPRAPARLPSRPARPGAFVGQDVVLGAVDSGDMKLVDSLKPAAFAGIKKSRYGRPGHIPTAVNVPYESLLEGGRFKSTTDIRDIVEAAGLGGDAPVLAY